MVDLECTAKSGVKQTHLLRAIEASPDGEALATLVPRNAANLAKVDRLGFPPRLGPVVDVGQSTRVSQPDEDGAVCAGSQLGPVGREGYLLDGIHMPRQHTKARPQHRIP